MCGPRPSSPGRPRLPPLLGGGGDSSLCAALPSTCRRRMRATRSRRPTRSAERSDQRRCVPPRPRPRRIISLGTTVFRDQRQNPYMRIVLIDHLPLRRPGLELCKHGIRTVSHPLDLIPLGGVGDGDTHHRLIPLQAVQRHSQVVAPQDQHGAGTGAVCVCPRLGRHGGREHLPAGRTAELLQRIPYRRQERMAVKPHLDFWLDTIQAPTPTDRAALAHSQRLMAADHVLSPAVGLGSLTAMPRAPLARRWRSAGAVSLPPPRALWELSPARLDHWQSRSLRRASAGASSPGRQTPARASA